MIQFLLKLTRKEKQIIIILFDCFSVIFCLMLAFYIRLGFDYFYSINSAQFLLISSAPLLALPIFTQFGLYRAVIRYVEFIALWKIIQAASLYSILWGLLSFMSGIVVVPRSVIIMNWLIIILFLGCSRLFARWVFSDLTFNKNVIIYGAGSAGRQLSTALKQSNEYKPIGFIDDSKELLGQFINGLEVFSKNELDLLIKKKKINEVLLAIPSASRQRRSNIINFLEPFPVAVRSLPGVSEIAQGKVKVNDLLDIDIDDLLGRSAAQSDKSLLKTNIYKKVVLVTGAGGSIGSELCRQILVLKPSKLLLFDMSETSLYHIEQEINNNNELSIEVIPIIGSVLDKEKMINICQSYFVNTIYHAAAYKHVPLVEQNIIEGIRNNLIGTMRAAEAAISSNVDIFVLISTDKAVRPTNVMGASKRASEIVLQSFSEISTSTCFTMVRFGNVLDSSGSVIPLFKKQISQGGPVTVTHTNIVRFFMTIPEAVQLVIQAGSLAQGGEVFVLDMGKPVKIHDLAIKMIKLSGLTVRDEKNPDGDIEIQYTGLRPGEKLYEELLVDGKFELTQNKLIMRSEENIMTWEFLKPLIDRIQTNLAMDDEEKTLKTLKEIVPSFSSQG